VRNDGRGHIAVALGSGDHHVARGRLGRRLLGRSIGLHEFDAVGAALANGGGQLAVSIPTFLYAERAVGRVPWRLTALTPAAAAALGTGLAAWACVSLVDGIAGFLLGMAAAGATFAILARLLRILPREDAVWLDEAAGARLGGRLGRLSRALARQA
jgi:hypothetical protein